jgi:diguanylate cyclase (GGDEF)-like protein
MMHAPAGILLPASTLTQPWFIVLATAVAFNTIIYLGLTLSKLIPWPHQFHPARIRRLVRVIGARPEPQSELDASAVSTGLDLVTTLQREHQDPFIDLRHRVARASIPQGFALAGCLVLLVTLTGLVFIPNRSALHVALLLLFGAGLLICAQVLLRKSFSANAMIWSWVVFMIVLSSLLGLFAIASGNEVDLAYMIIVLSSFAPLTLSWTPALVGIGVIFAEVLIAAQIMPVTTGVSWLAAALAAALSSATMLRLRIISVDSMTTKDARSTAMATTDLLTGMLTRRGLITLLPGMAAMAERTSQHVCLVTIRVEELHRANAQYGTHYGDDVLRTVAASVRATVRRGDYVARWGDDEFLMVGIGNVPNAEVISQRIDAMVEHSGVNLGKWPILVRVRAVAGDPAQTTFDALLEQASPAQLPG